MADILGWSQQRVNQYNSLQKIVFKAWCIITTEIEKNVLISNNGDVVKNTTTVVFNEGLLRNIISLYAWQQIELVENSEFLTCQ